MKVALIIDTWFPKPGGGQINSFEISKRLAEKGVNIDIITRNNGKDKLTLPKNLRVIKLTTSIQERLDITNRIVFIVKAFFFIYKNDYSLIHAHAFLPGIPARLASVFKGTPSILTVHGTSINTSLNNIFSKIVEKFILTKILYNAQITVSRDFLRLKNINKKVVYIPNGINISVFNKTKTKKFVSPTIIFVGRLHPQKNLPVLIDTMIYLTKEINGIQLLIVGEGPEKNTLRNRVNKLGLSKNIKFLGAVFGKDLVKLYKSCHIFVLPSIYEGQPLSLLEAWAAKLPVVVSKTGDCISLIKNGHNGYLINNPQDPQEISKLILNGLSSKSEEMGLNGYNLVKQRFSWENSASLTKSLYEQIIHGQ